MFVRRTIQSHSDFSFLFKTTSTYFLLSTKINEVPTKMSVAMGENVTFFVTVPDFVSVC